MVVIMFGTAADWGYDVGKPCGHFSCGMPCFAAIRSRSVRGRDVAYYTLIV
jgi:hypothetical protein